MRYSIGHFTECCKNRDLEVWIYEEGDLYGVSLSTRFPESGRTVTRRTFESLQEAYKVFEKLVSWMVFEHYTEDQKRQFLETGTMA